MSVIQEWVGSLPMMQQSVLLAAIRGPDGLPKYGSVKLLLRWYRRCILLSAIDGRVLSDPISPNGGSFTGPSIHSCDSWQDEMDKLVDDYLKMVDAIPHHFQMHFIHAIEILGYKHPTNEIRHWWNSVYKRLVRDLHLHPESKAELDERLGDSRDSWLKYADPATTE